MIPFLNFRPGLFSFFLIGFLISGCNERKGCLDPEASNYEPDAEVDDGSCRYGEEGDGAPPTYEFSDADLMPGHVRIQLLDRMLQKVGQAENGGSIAEQELLQLYRNEGVVGGGEHDIEETLRIQDRTRYETIFQEIADRSGDPSALVAGRFVDPDSIEYRALIREGLMKASFYHYATDELLEGLDAAEHGNPHGSDPTDRERRYDEAFSLFGVPRDFDRSTPFGASPDHSSGAWFWGVACLRTDSALGHAGGLFAEFVKGRWALTNEKSEQRNGAVKKVEEGWERTSAALMIRHIKRTIDAMNAQELGERIHHWSLVHALQGNAPVNADGIISPSEHQEVREWIGGSPNEPSPGDLNEAMALLQEIYGFSNQSFQAL